VVAGSIARSYGGLSTFASMLSSSTLFAIAFAIALLSPVLGTAQTRPAERIVAGFDSTRPAERRQHRPAPLKELRDDIDALLSTPEWHGAHVGVCVMSLDGGELIYRRNDDALFTPASVQKLFTTAAALAIFGPEHSFSTTLSLDGTLLPSGEFVGNVILKGGADPTWSAAFGVDAAAMFDEWADVLDSLGIRSIKGNIIGDDDMFDDVAYAPGWAWDDLPWSYAPQVGPLALYDNAVAVSVTHPGLDAEPPQVRLHPETEYVRVIPSIRVLDSTGVTALTPLRDPSSNVIELNGTLAGITTSDTVTVRLSVDNPTAYTLWHFRAALQRRGIRFRGALLDIDDVNDVSPDERTQVVIEHSSMPLRNIVAVINQTSHNLGAEMLLKAMGWQQGQGSWDRGVDVIKAVLRREGVGSGMAIADGSGLSRLNLCTPHQVATLLARANKASWGAAFKASLAVPGQVGTLRRRMIGSRAEHAVRAKTGSMNNVSTLAGYVTTRDGEAFAFSIMLGNFIAPQSMAHNLQDLVCMRLASFSRKLGQ
jgi:D-alanyl-D-alanine carboxypeptidase/D-alanyl-D-alanine-endopeptidase (penicillin-binding protein 4)